MTGDSSRQDTERHPPLSDHEAAALLTREAHCLDHRLWDEWLELYTEDAVFWMPAWRSEDETTTDPDRELSLIFYEGRARLAERVWRLRSGQSPASVPLQRTMHSITNIAVELRQPGTASVRSNWTVHCHDPKRKTQHVYFGFYVHGFRWAGTTWRIERKRIVLLNDYIPAVLDFYGV